MVVAKSFSEQPKTVIDEIPLDMRCKNSSKFATGYIISSSLGKYGKRVFVTFPLNELWAVFTTGVLLKRLLIVTYEKVKWTVQQNEVKTLILLYYIRSIYLKLK